MHLHFIPKTIDHATILVPQLLTKIPNMYWKVTHIPFSIRGGQWSCRTVFFGIALTTLIPNKFGMLCLIFVAAQRKMPKRNIVWLRPSVSTALKTGLILWWKSLHWLTSMSRNDCLWTQLTGPPQRPNVLSNRAAKLTFTPSDGSYWDSNSSKYRKHTHFRCVCVKLKCVLWSLRLEEAC